MVIGGAFGPVQGSGYLAIDGHLSPNWTVRNQKDTKLTTTLGFSGEVPCGVLSFAASDGSLPYRLEYQKSDLGWWDLNYGEAANGTVLSFSTSKAQDGAAQLRFPNGFSIGRGANAHKFSASLTPPASGEHVGEVVFSSDPARTGYIGWVWVQKGTAGDWYPFGPLVRTRTTVAGAKTSPANVQDVSFSYGNNTHRTLTFEASAGGIQKVILHADVNSSVITHLVSGTHLDFVICQDDAGGHVFHWPGIVRGGMNIGKFPHSCSAQSFVFDGNLAFATSAGATTLNSN